MTLVPIHILAGLIGIVSGYVAMYALKGASLHRKSGMVFVYSMLVMASTAAVMSVMNGEKLNMSMGVLTLYMVTTGLLTVRRRVAERQWMDAAAVPVGLMVGAYLYSLGFEAARTPSGTIDGIPAPGAFLFGSIALLSAVGDVRMIRAGGLRGRPRLVRHLWRMCFAAFVATGSFFFGQPQVFPEQLRGSAPLIFLGVLPLLVMFYWLARVRVKRTVAALEVAPAK